MSPNGPETQTQPAVVHRMTLVEPGDAAPPNGEPFDPAVNFDQDLGQSVRVLKRGDKTTVMSSVPLTEEVIEGLKVEAARRVEAIEALVPPPPAKSPSEAMLDDMVATGVVDPSSDKPGTAYRD